jgi:hypothetical protein
VLKKIRNQDASWETLVPAAVAAGIKRRGLFGCGALKVKAEPSPPV